MRYPLPSLICLLLVLGLATAAPAQTWQMPNPDLGVPKPQGPRLPTLGNLADDQQARIRAQNQANMDEVDRYNAQQAQRNQLIEEAKQDFAKIERERREQAEFNTQFEARNKPQYEAAYQALAEMLDGRRTVSLPLAVFVVENSYAAGELNYTAFKADLDELATICRSLGGTDASSAARFMALHRLMTDTVRVSYAGKVVSKHLPYRYDFTDFWGKEDYSKMFVTKLLRTNSGQCHSLPLLYKMLADQLGVKTYISMAPNHTYIQVLDDRGELYSYETTNHRFVTDSYYMSTGYVKAAALKNRSYLDTLTTKEVLASRLFDLGLCYEHRYGLDDFVRKCGLLGLRYYPQSVVGRMSVHNAALAKFTKAWAAAGKPTEEQARRNPALQPLWADVAKWAQAVREVGHEDMPPDQYARWLNATNQEQTRQDAQQAARFEQTAHK